MDQEELSNSQKCVIKPIVSAINVILAAINDAEPYGVMGSELYLAAAEETGCSLECFSAAIEALVFRGILERHGNCYCRSTRLSPTVEQSLAE
jgi:hypothetical protein